MCVCVRARARALIAVVLTWHILQVEVIDPPKSDIHYRSVQDSTKHIYDVCKTRFINSRILCYLLVFLAACYDVWYAGVL